MTSIKCVDLLLEYDLRSVKFHNPGSSQSTATTGGRLRQISRSHAKLVAVEGVSFSIEAGERIALLGHNGSGKSSLIKLLCKIYQPNSGSVEIVGEVGSLTDISLGLNEEDSGAKNIFLRGLVLGRTRSEIRDAFEDIVDFSELGNFIDLPMRTYSSGMNMRLAFAIATVFQPEILIMDEWLSVGDESFRRKAENKLKTMAEQAKIVVIATHSRELVDNLCTRAIWLEHGRIKMDGPALEVAKAYFG